MGALQWALELEEGHHQRPVVQARGLVAIPPCMVMMEACRNDGLLIQFNLLHSKFHLCSVPTCALILSIYIKIVNLFPEVKPTMRDMLHSDSQLQNADVDLQEHAMEYLWLSTMASTHILAIVLKETPPFPEWESSILAKPKKKIPNIVADLENTKRERNVDVNGGPESAPASSSAVDCLTQAAVDTCFVDLGQTCLALFVEVFCKDPAVRGHLMECLETILNKTQKPPKSKKVHHSNIKNGNAGSVQFVLHVLSNPLLLLPSHSELNLLIHSGNQLGQFLQHWEPNLHYLALESMCTLASSEFSHKAVKTHVEMVINALKSSPCPRGLLTPCAGAMGLPMKAWRCSASWLPTEMEVTKGDMSVQQWAMDLLYAMCDHSNAPQIVAEMLIYLEMANYFI
ncbi:hypothetical protein P7K49_032066 [Saguinus oedipus]|uniref:Uncharacterized protein n=1 Tax=Saguinus oedipus TaxID=9490 RepID=A0ABQ9TY33_SAGOE|nr:hypothetical protein P7K49_032066 [Saguinus oedipus]